MLPDCPTGFFLCDPFGAVQGGIFSLLSAILPEPLPIILVTAIGITMVTTLVAIIVMSQVWAERRIVAFMQGRLGPNRVGPQGLLQAVADAIKLLTKEGLIPREADRVAFLLAPLVVVVP